MYFDKTTLYLRDLCRMHATMRVIVAVNEEETQRDTHFEQSQRRIGEESEDTDANRLYSVVPKKGETDLRAHLPRGLVREGLLSSPEKMHTNIYGPKLLIRPALLWVESTRVCACKCDATAGRWYFGVRRGPGDRRPLYIRARARERLLIKY